MKIVLFANTDWYLYNFRLPLAQALRAEGHEVVLVSPHGKYAERLSRAGFRVVRFPLVRRRLNPLAEIITVLRLALLYRRERPALVHHFTVKCVIHGSIAARLAGVGAVVNALAGLGHIFAARDAQARALRAVVKFVLRFAMRRTQVVFQNPDDCRAFLKAGLVAEKNCHLIRGSGVDVHRFKPKAARVSSRSTRRVLLASRLLRSKGVIEYVEAARLVRRELPQALFLLAGEPDEGNPDSIPRELVASWREQQNVEALGQCEEMDELIGRCDLVVLPTSYGEGVPRILVEAAACGKALVATDHPGCREIVIHGSNGLLVPPRDADALAEAIATLLVDDERRTEMGRRSRELACREYSQERVNEDTIRVYRIALGGEAHADNKNLDEAASLAIHALGD